MPIGMATEKPARRLFRFSLRTLLAFVLIIASSVFLYREWAPWHVIAVCPEQPTRILHDDAIDAKTIAISRIGLSLSLMSAGLASAALFL